MGDPVNLADVIERQPNGWRLDREAVVRAVLAHGGGDPVVVLPDGTLRRMGGPLGYELTDPVVK